MIEHPLIYTVGFAFLLRSGAIRPLDGVPWIKKLHGFYYSQYSHPTHQSYAFCSAQEIGSGVHPLSPLSYPSILHSHSMFDHISFDTLAHYTRGMATMFFIIQAVQVYGIRKRNRMTLLLFVAIVYIALCYVKDIIFLSASLMEFDFMESLVSIIDITCTPFACALFYEGTSPRSISFRKLLLLYLPFAAFIPLFCLLRTDILLYADLAFSGLVSAITMVLVTKNIKRYKKCLSDNYSHTKDISVTWIAQYAVIYFAWFFVYSLCFYKPTWVGEVVYDLFSMLIWSVLCICTRHHHIIAEMLAPLQQASDDAGRQEEPADTDAPARERNVNVKDSTDASIACALKQCMEEEKLYLNPRLTLAELSMAVGTNRSYISEYINRQGKSFYDYINAFRVAESCSIIDGMHADEKITMAEIAARSGFNSISSFNRNFYKIMGVTPSKYLQQKEEPPYLQL